MSESKIRINTTVILWVCVTAYILVLLIGLIHAMRGDNLQCEGLNGDLWKVCMENSRAAWGQFGDYLGGVFNPVVGLFTIFLLVSTIKQQSRALDQTEDALSHANAALEQNKLAIEQSEKALQQNAEALELTRREMKRGIEVQESAAEHQEKTKNVLKAELMIVKNKAIRDELESMIAAFENELNSLMNREFSELWRVQNEQGNFVTPKSLMAAVEKKVGNLAFQLERGTSAEKGKIDAAGNLLRACKIVIEHMIGATRDLMPYLNTGYAWAYWQEKTAKYVFKLVEIGIFTEEEAKEIANSFGDPPN